MRRRGPNIDWDYVDWLRSFNRSWDTIAHDLGITTKSLVDAHDKRCSRARELAGGKRP